MLPTIKLAQLKLGETAIIKEFTDKETALKFMEMGCLPGELVTMQRFAPMGDPIAISVSGYILSMRKSEASCIIVTKN